MKKDSYKVIGVMSGTSLDGIDLCYASFQFNHKWSYSIIDAITIPYSEEWRIKLKHGIDQDMSELKALDTEYTWFLSETIRQYLNKEQLTGLDAICSHGHTILHQPQEGITYQIGNQPEIAKALSVPVVCDFRVQDVELGGQGAPLVPIGDKYLFSEYDACLNLGGFSNVSYEKDGQRIAFDICPVNIVLNELAGLFDLPYDHNGDLARSGKIDEQLLNDLNGLQFYKLPAPKSLGLEWVKEKVNPILSKSELSTKNKLRTFTEHIGFQIANQLNKLDISSVLITGGGALNSFLIDRIEHYLDNPIVIPEMNTINFKEALVFGFLGILKLREEVNCLSSVTGARHDHSSGKIYQP
ncbi:MAG: anhydro-N-acetylmuramic acid kinase [Bacteroidia bacterium]|nr:anhydro-N-acetylmuramic acid kinase [Bacteroidia bacterium]MBT8268854.1 anhydro-N-acetylmuramic acid kinase [Bacteroidia bacterium]MBT8286946.1 anhydro-N-acetylmuramic acid kinase [Bacteroidia bacterium]NNK70992.1 anhydro-N-acetylmuramic acid kinase [Flavobacteriaceae bacterium]NNL79425.1 anhydro-N-acetylmuramic acid kinase [Flavobacteriaceae bacterium]